VIFLSVLSIHPITPVLPVHASTAGEVISGNGSGGCGGGQYPRERNEAMDLVQILGGLSCEPDMRTLL
jgi:hypothetical protein